MISKSQRDFIKDKILKKFSDVYVGGSADDLKRHHKKDNSLVTEIDIFVSDLVKSELSGMNNLNFYCEEDHSELKFPSLVLDPIDGTKGLSIGLAECSFSLALMKSPKIEDCWGWIFNPFTGFDICSEDRFFPALNYQNRFLSCLVSRSEWDSGLYKKESLNPSLFIAPKGSIALKLGYLATGACDFVISKKPKNIWDVAAGTILCKERGVQLFIGKKKQSNLDTKRLDAPLIWCREEVLDHVWHLFNFQ